MIMIIKLQMAVAVRAEQHHEGEPDLCKGFGAGRADEGLLSSVPPLVVLQV